MIGYKRGIHQSQPLQAKRVVNQCKINIWANIVPAKLQQQLVSSVPK